MNIFLKYIIFFLLGFITYLFINKTKIIEGFDWQAALSGTDIDPPEQFYFSMNITDLNINLNGINTIRSINNKLLIHPTLPQILQITKKTGHNNNNLNLESYYFENISNNYINNYLIIGYINTDNTDTLIFKIYFNNDPSRPHPETTETRDTVVNQYYYSYFEFATGFITTNGVASFNREYDSLNIYYYKSTGYKIIDLNSYGITNQLPITIRLNKEKTNAGKQKDIKDSILLSSKIVGKNEHNDYIKIGCKEYTCNNESKSLNNWKLKDHDAPKYNINQIQTGEITQSEYDMNKNMNWCINPQENINMYDSTNVCNHDLCCDNLVCENYWYDNITDRDNWNNQSENNEKNICPTERPLVNINKKCNSHKSCKADALVCCKESEYVNNDGCMNFSCGGLEKKNTDLSEAFNTCTNDNYDTYNLKLLLNPNNIIGDARNLGHMSDNIIDAETFLLNNFKLKTKCSADICCYNNKCGNGTLTDNDCKLFKAGSKVIKNKDCSQNDFGLGDSCNNISHCCLNLPEFRDTSYNMYNLILDFKLSYIKEDKYDNLDNIITGLDMRNYLYYNLLDLENMNNNNQSVNQWPFIKQIPCIGDYNTDVNCGRTNTLPIVEYSDFDLLSRWLDTLNFNNTDDLSKILLKDYIHDKVIDTQTSGGLGAIWQGESTGQMVRLSSIIDRLLNTLQKINPDVQGKMGIIVDDDIKKLIILLDNNNPLYANNQEIFNNNLKPLDYFFNSFSNQYKNASMDKNIFFSNL